MDAKKYPITLIEELFAASVFLIRNFELSPFSHGTLEEEIMIKVHNGKL